MANLRPLPTARDFSLARDSLRNLNLFLHKQAVNEGVSHIQVKNPDGAHSASRAASMRISMYRFTAMSAITWPA